MEKDGTSNSDYRKGFVNGFSRALSLFSHLVERNIEPEKIIAECQAMLEENIRPWAEGKTKRPLD